MAFQRPGVYVQETLTPVAPVAGPSSDSVGAFLGANDRGPTTPTLVTSWSQYVNKFGLWNSSASNDLALGVYMFFANGGNSAYVTRVVGSGAASATRTFNDRQVSATGTLQVSALNQGTWGNNVNISISNSSSTGYFDLTVFYGGSSNSNIVERWTDMSMTSTDARYALTVVNGNSNYITLTDLASSATAPDNNPAVVSNQALSTGANGSAPSGTDVLSSLDGYDVIRQSLILNVPGFTDATTVNGLISYAEERQDVFVVIDGINDTVANQITLANTYTASSFGAVYYPPLVISDPTVGLGAPRSATKTVGAGAAAAGLYAATDASRGVFKAPAGLGARIAGAVSVTALTNSELDTLNSNSAAVNAIRYIPGSGIVVMGSRTLKNTFIDKYVPVRRTLIYLEKSLKDLTQFAIFEPNDERLWRRLNATISAFLTAFWSQGGLRGGTPDQAYFVKVDSDNNPQSTIDNGEVHIEVGVALQRPAEFVVIKIGQYDGGTTVTIA